MPRVLVDVAASGGFGPAQWLALLGAALLSVCVAVFLCGSSSTKGGGGKAPALAQEMADRSAAATSTTRTGCEDAPTPEMASRSAATASSASTSGGGDLERGRRDCCVCAGWPDCGPCGGPCYGGFAAEGVDFSSCRCCCDGCDCGGVDCSGVDCSVCVDCVGGCCGACMMLLASC